VFSCLALACGAGSASAQSVAPPPSGGQALLDNSWVMNLGAFIVNSDLTASLNGQSVTNPDVDFDQRFGRGSDATRVRGDVLWRITPTQHMRFMYFNNSTTRSRVQDDPLKWGDYTFNAGSRVDMKYKFQVTELAYEYAFVRQPTYEWAASLGVHYSKTTLELSGAASITDPNGNTSTVSSATKSNSVPAPLPVIGLRVGWAFAPQWYLDGQVQFFKVNYQDYDGNWSDFRVGTTWMFSKNFGVGLGYDRFSTKVGVSRSSFDGKLNATYSGLQLYLTGTF
jgi:hypothetical protein